MTVTRNFYFLFVFFNIEFHGQVRGFYNKPRIWKGDPVAIEDAPYTVEIYHHVRNWICGTGVLIEVDGVQAVLTSRNNLKGYLNYRTNDPETTVTIYAGSDVSRKGVTVKLTKATYYPFIRGSPDLYLDKIAILHLEHNFPVSDKIQPAQLPAKDLVHVPDLFVTGWGHISWEGSMHEFSGLRGYHTTLCDANDQDEDRKEFMICVSNPPGQGPSRDDAGGPAVAIIDGVTTVVGIVASNAENKASRFDHLIRVNLYLDWIVNTVLQEKEGKGQFGIDYWYWY